MMSPRQYAQHRRTRKLAGANLSAVQRAISRGRITTTRGKIDAARADKEWVTNTRAHQPGQLRGKRLKGSRQDANLAKPGSIRHFETRLIALKVKKAEHELALLSGKWMKVEDVKKLAFNQGRVYRDQLLGLPDRIIPMVAAECGADPAKLAVAFDKYFQGFLAQLSESIVMEYGNETKVGN
jgi:hypothetical protein